MMIDRYFRICSMIVLRGVFFTVRGEIGIPGRMMKTLGEIVSRFPALSVAPLVLRHDLLEGAVEVNVNRVGQ
jgi:hypothetical protein